MEHKEQTRLIRYLKEELALPAHCVEVALRQCQASVGSLPIVLWQYGFIDRMQLERVLDWIETS